MKKKLFGFSLIEMLIVMSIIIILGSFGAGAFLGFRETALVREDVETLKQDVQLAQHLAMNMKKGDEQFWVYGIGIDLGDISTNGNYRFFKWCSEFRDFGDTLTKSEIIAYDPSKELGVILGYRSEVLPPSQNPCFEDCSTRDCSMFCVRNPGDSYCQRCGISGPIEDQTDCSAGCDTRECAYFCKQYPTHPDCQRCFPTTPQDPIVGVPLECANGCTDLRCVRYCSYNPGDPYCVRCSGSPGPGDGYIIDPDPIYERSMELNNGQDPFNFLSLFKPKQTIAQEVSEGGFDPNEILNGYLPPGMYGTSCSTGDGSGVSGGVLVRIPGYEQDRIVDVAKNISVLGGLEGAHYIVFESITGRAFLYDSNGKPVNYSGGGDGNPLTFDPTKTLDVLIERRRSSKFDVVSILPISGTVIHHVYGTNDEVSTCQTGDQCLTVGGKSYTKYTLQSEIESYR